jgi:hypothetical protein
MNAEFRKPEKLLKFPLIFSLPDHLFETQSSRIGQGDDMDRMGFYTVGEMVTWSIFYLPETN